MLIVGLTAILLGFHDTVLASGMVPMPVLEAQVDAWIQSRQAP